MIIRSWKYEDILRISEIEKECFPGEPWTFRMLASSFESDAFFGVLAEDGGEIAGYGGVTVASDSADIANQKQLRRQRENILQDQDPAHVPDPKPAVKPASAVIVNRIKAQKAGEHHRLRPPLSEVKIRRPFRQDRQEE